MGRSTPDLTRQAPFPIGDPAGPGAFHDWMELFCFSDGEAIRQEGGAVPMWRIGQAA
jgi:hypothetical protein